jgi:hypothetical protein
VALSGAPKDPTPDKFLVGIAIVAFCTLALACGAVVIFSRTTDSNPAGVTISGSPAAGSTFLVQDQRSGMTPHAGVQPSGNTTTPGSADICSSSALAAAKSGKLAVTPASAASGSNSAASSAVAHSASTGQQVLPADLNNLADKVKLDGGALQNVDAAEWAQQLPNAEQMLQGMCDCEQRNWLNRFVTTANDAIAGSNNYFTSVKILDQMPRTDDELTTRTVSN